MSCLCSVCRRHLPQGDRAFCLQGAALSSDNHRHSPPNYSEAVTDSGDITGRETSLRPLRSSCIVEQTVEITSFAEFLLAAEQNKIHSGGSIYHVNVCICKGMCWVWSQAPPTAAPPLWFHRLSSRCCRLCWCRGTSQQIINVRSQMHPTTPKLCCTGSSAHRPI